MRVRYLGEAAREQRKLLGVRQELVCEGLCTTMTLSRFESGRQTPSRDCVAAILQRLGLPDDRHYAQLTRRETQLVRLRKETIAYCSQFEQARGDERQKVRMDALEKLRSLERCVKADDHINQQFILGAKVTLRAYPPQEQLGVLMEAIRLTSPRFDPNDLGRCLYSTGEVVIINQLALHHSFCGQSEKAIDIYRQLLKLLLKRTPDHSCLYLVAYDYAWCLASANRLKEALEISQIGRQACIQRGYYRILPRFLHIEAECRYLMDEVMASRELYQSAYHIYKATMDITNLEILKADVAERFNTAF